MTDIEIAKSVELKKITEIAQAIDITEDELEMYGRSEVLRGFTKRVKQGKFSC